MKNKKSIYILLPVVIFIWGTIIYKILKGTTTTPEEVTTFHQKNTPLNLSKKKANKLDVNYRDPFLGKTYQSKQVVLVSPSKKTSVKRKQTQKSTPIPTKETIIWPNIRYKGIVSDTKSKSQVFMITIDGKTFLMKPNTIENDILLLEGDRDEIEVKYKKESKFILIDE